MRFDFKATMEDGSLIEVQSDARDLRRWEADYKAPIVGQAMSLTYLTQIAYLAMRRQGALNGEYPDYETFDAHCIELNSSRTNLEALVGNPTPPEATEDSSAS